jgi:hypothetical protein
MLRVAHAFGRPDVDRLMQEMDEDQFQEWCDFFVLEPTGWNALKLAAGWVAFWVAQVRTKRKLKPSKFIPKTAAEATHSDEAERARWEAMAVRTEIEERVRTTGK